MILCWGQMKETTRSWHMIYRKSGRQKSKQAALYWEASQINKIISRMFAAAAAAKPLQLCQTLCDPRDGSPPGSPVPGILQARTLEWFAISFSNAWKWKVKVKSLSCVRRLATPWTAAHQAPLSLGFSRQEYWSGLPFPSPMHYRHKKYIQRAIK